MKRRVHPDVGRFPPCSRLALLQERTRGDPWRCLVSCVLLNLTKGVDAEPVLWEILRRWPDAPSLAAADRAEVEALLRPLGLQRRRSASLLRLSAEYAAGEWSDPIELHGVGRYARESWALFVELVRVERPSDKVLMRYVALGRDR